MPIAGVSSMATRQILADASARYAAETGADIAFESVGGVDAARRVREGEAFDLVALASDALGKLEAEGHVLTGSIRGFARSPMAVAVRAGWSRTEISSEEAVRELVAAAATVGYSTGPSGAHVLRLLKAWGLDGPGGPRAVQAKPGVPVGALVARGEAEVGFQQLSELMDEPGIDVLGLLPAAIQNETVFAIGVGARSAYPDKAEAFIAWAASPGLDEAKRRRGMQPA